MAVTEPDYASIYSGPRGTAVKIRTDSTISTKSAQTGEAFTGVLAEPLKVDGEVVAPRGAAVTGLVAEADEGGRVKGVASLTLRLTKITVEGKAVPVETGVFVKNAPTTKKKDAIKGGMGAGGGAVVGASAGGGKGAAIGAASGAGVGTAAQVMTKGQRVRIPSETRLTFTLQQAVRL